MKLIRLLTNSTTALWDVDLNDTVNIEPYSKICLSSLAVQVNLQELEIDSVNNEMRYQLADDTGTRTIYLNEGKYNIDNFNDFFLDMTSKFNKSLLPNYTSDLGVEFRCFLDVNTKKTNIEMKYAPLVNFENFTGDDFVALNVGKSGNVISRQGGIDGTNDSFVSCKLPCSRGNSSFRARLLFNDGTFEYSTLLALRITASNSSTTSIPLNTIKYGMGYKSIDDILTYYYILNGFEIITTYEFVDEDYASIDIYEGLINLNVYRVGDETITLFSTPYDNTTFLYPSIIFKSDRDRAELIRLTPSPYVNNLDKLKKYSFNGGGDDLGLSTIPSLKKTKSKHYIQFSDSRLSSLLGYDYFRQPVSDGITEEGGIVIFISQNNFNPALVNQSYMLEMLNFNIPSSYDTYTNQRKNILATINQPVYDLTRLTFESYQHIWLDLENKTPISLRNVKMRLQNEDGSTVITQGLSQATILIKSSNE